MPTDATRSTREPASDGAGLAVPAGLVDLVSGLALLAAATVFWLAAGSFEEADHTGIGPATFPRGIAALLAMTSLMLAVRGLAALAGRAPTYPVQIGRPFGVLAGIGLICAFPALMQTLGYYVATALWLPAFLLVAGYRRPLGIVLVTTGFMVFAKVAFELALGVRLP